VLRWHLLLLNWSSDNICNRWAEGPIPLPSRHDSHKNFGTRLSRQNADPSRFGCSGHGMAAAVGSEWRANIQYCIILLEYCAQPGEPRGKWKVESSMSGDFSPVHSSPSSHRLISWLLKRLRLYKYSYTVSKAYKQACIPLYRFPASWSGSLDNCWITAPTATTQLTTRHKTASKQSNTSKPLHTLPLLKKKHLQVNINIASSSLILSLSKSKTRET